MVDVLAYTHPDDCPRYRTWRGSWLKEPSLKEEPDLDQIAMPLRSTTPERSLRTSSALYLLCVLAGCSSTGKAPVESEPCPRLVEVSCEEFGPGIACDGLRRVAKEFDNIPEEKELCSRYLGDLDAWREMRAHACEVLNEFACGVVAHVSDLKDSPELCDRVRALNATRQADECVAQLLHLYKIPTILRHMKADL